MNPALLERIEDARWSGKDTVAVKVSELDAMVAELTQLRQERIQGRRDEEFNDNEKLVGFIKLEALQELRQSKTNSARLLRYQSKPYYVVPVYVKLSAIQRLSKCPNPSAK